MSGLVVAVLRGVAHAAGAIVHHELNHSVEQQRYQGGRLNGKPHGQGRMTYRDGSVYTGSFIHGKRHGIGQLVLASGGVKEGNWSRDQLTGHGSTRTANGALYVGELFAGVPNGEGSYTYVNGTIAHGSWVAGKLRGRGEIIWPQGSYFRGNFWDDAKHGVGIQCDLRTGVCWEQEWQQGKLASAKQLDRTQVPADIVAKFFENGAIQSPGVVMIIPPVSNLPTKQVVNLKIPNAAGERTYTGTVLKNAPTVPHGPGGRLVAPTFTYEGTFEKGTFHGPGRVILPNGAVREGNYFKSKLQGLGRYTNPGVSIYEGSFVDSKFSGRGVQRFLATRNVYDCEWKDGVPDGFGTIVTPKTNDVYTGGIKNYKAQGYGRKKYGSLQQTYVGTWKDGGRDVGTVWRHAQDAKIPVYQGQFVDGLAHGHGKAILKSGWIFEGTWKKGHIEEGLLVRLTDGQFYRGTFVASKLTIKTDEGKLPMERVVQMAQIDAVEAEDQVEGGNVSVVGSPPLISQAAVGASVAVSSSSAAPATVVSIPITQSDLILSTDVDRHVPLAAMSLAGMPSPSAPPQQQQQELEDGEGVVEAASSSLEEDNLSSLERAKDVELSSPPAAVAAWSVQDVLRWIQQCEWSAEMQVLQSPSTEEAVNEPGAPLAEVSSSSSSASSAVLVSPLTILQSAISSACVDGELLLSVRSKSELIELGVPATADAATQLLKHIEVLRERNAAVANVVGASSSPESSSPQLVQGASVEAAAPSSAVPAPPKKTAIPERAIVLA